MRKMTKTVLGILLMSSVAFVSCKKENTIEKAPVNNPISTDYRDVIEGSYLMLDSLFNDNSSLWQYPGQYQSKKNYLLQITKQGTGDSIVMNNYNNEGISIVALYINGFISIPSQYVLASPLLVLQIIYWGFTISNHEKGNEKKNKNVRMHI